MVESKEKHKNSQLYWKSSNIWQSKKNRTLTKDMKDLIA